MRGAWLWTLCEMWRDRVPKITRTVAQWARAWNVGESHAQRIIDDMATAPKVCEVTYAGNHDLVTPRVTLTCRRLSRRHKERIQARLRKQTERAKGEASGDCHGAVKGGVTSQVVVPSSSSSPSSSPSSSEKSGDEGAKPITQTPEETAAKLVEQEASRKTDAGAVRDYSVQPPTLSECMAAAAAVGMREADVERFRAHYGAQGWLYPNRLAIRSLSDAMGRWKAIQADRDARANKQAGDGGHVPADERAVAL